jgi:hypothetical protein
MVLQAFRRGREYFVRSSASYRCSTYASVRAECASCGNAASKMAFERTFPIASKVVTCSSVQSANDQSHSVSTESNNGVYIGGDGKPTVEVDRLDFADVRSETAVHAAAADAQSDAEVPARPLGVRGAAICAAVVPGPRRKVGDAASVASFRFRSRRHLGGGRRGDVHVDSLAGWSWLSPCPYRVVDGSILERQFRASVVFERQAGDDLSVAGRRRSLIRTPHGRRRRRHVGTTGNGQVR